MPWREMVNPEFEEIGDEENAEIKFSVPGSKLGGVWIRMPWADAVELGRELVEKCPEEHDPYK